MTVGPNVGHAEVDVDLDVDRLVAQGRDAGEDAGEQFGEGFFRSADGRLRDASGRFVSEQRSQGRRAGGLFGRAFSRGLSDSNPFSGLRAQADIQANRILATFIRLGPVIAAALGAAVAFGPALAAGLPFLAAMAGLVGVIALGWDDVKRAVQPLDRLFTKLQDPIGAILTDGIRPLVAELADRLLPVLKSGLGDIAAATNNVITGFLNWLSATETLQLLSDLLSGVAPVLETLGQAAVVFSDALLRVAVAAIPAFQMLADFLLSGAVAFRDWIIGLQQTGELTTAISGSMEILLGFIARFAELFGQVLQLGNALGPAGLAFFTGLIDVLSVLIDLLIPVANLLSQNAESVQIFAQALGVLILASAGVQTLALILTGAVGALAALAAAFTIAFQNSATFREVIAQVAAFFQTQFVPAVEQAATWVQTVLVPALQEFAGFIQTNVLPVLVELVNFFVSVGQGIAAFVGFVMPVITVLAGLFLPALQLLGQALAVLIPAILDLGRALGPILKPALIVLAALFVAASLVMVGAFLAAILVVTAAIRVLTVAIRVVTAVTGFYVGVVRAVVNVVGGALSGALNAAVAAFGSVAGSIRTVIGVVQSIIGFIGNLIGVIGRLPSSVPQPFGSWDFLTTVIGWVSDLLGFLADVPGSLPNPIDWDIGGVVGLIGDVVDLLGSIPSSLPNPFAGWSVPDLPDLPSFDVPGFASGGIIDGPIIAGLGEAGREVVVPLTKPNRALDLLERSGAADLLRNAGRAGGGGQTRVYGAENVYVTAPTDDPETIAEQFINRVSSRVVA